VKCDNPYILVLVGTVLSGKSTWIKNNYSGVNVISRDEIILQLSKTEDYNLAFRSVDGKIVDKLLLKKFIEANQTKTSTIVDMTNITKKRRMKTLSYFSDDFQKIAVVFPILTSEEYQIRNEKRSLQENKWLPAGVILDMMQSFEAPTLDEGFNQIINITPN
jgi:predicted kinase